MKSTILAAILILCGGDWGTQARSFEARNQKVEQGGVLVFQISPYWMPPATTSPTIFIFEKHYKPNDKGTVFIGVNLDTSPGKYVATFNENGLRSGWDYEEIEVLAKSSQKTRLSWYTRKPSLRTDRQKIIVENAYNKSDKSTDLTGGLSYITPLCFNGGIIDFFGFIYNNNPYRKHEGIDLRIQTGMPVVATNRGKVILVARNFSREGNMIIMNHGLGIFSVYMHLSKFQVKEGDKIERGQLIAFSGKTGTGMRESHLHFSIKIHNSYVDPLSFIDTANEVLK